MKEEVSVAAKFLIKVVENGCNGSLSQEQLEGLQERLVELLCSRFENHWFPDKPNRGQAFRCIRVNEMVRKDSIIEQAASEIGLSYEQLQLPVELTLWVDPKEVCCRFGESQGSFCMLANFKNGGNGEVFLDQVNFDEIRKKSQELRDKMSQDMITRKNGRRGFLAMGLSNRVGGTTTPNFKGNRPFGQPGGQTVGFSSHHNGNHHHSHHNNNTTHHAHHPNHVHHGGNMGHHHNSHTPSPAAVSWYNSVNGSNGVSDMFSSSPPNPNHFYGLAKFSPPKYGYGSPSKWSSPPHHSSYGPPLPAKGGDKYHWFNSNKATIKA
ncbi:protein BTG3 [Folsomia candida]|uniref:Protein BTG3 n=1 Tax=Folsomia candida TaxID=158441 RepID=A0A226ETH6_FOLCA|nr:protein BTG3 [Folsomia candida]XP_021944391.1 protein BTG3 [Folsomia candida]XP_021944392.1 protein BTG3 [Folsomia candida]XP_021944393.1 protein BTG3 [Folsomia candida]OXA60913.1 Protein BTG3 [Folsomia candida]